MRQFIPSHVVTLQEREIPVMLVDGAAYTVDEWATETAADFEVTAEGAWTFAGRPFDGSVRSTVVPYDLGTDVVITVATACAAEAARQGSPAVGRGMDDTEDADAGDYEALDEALGRAATSEERRGFRAAYSAALAGAAR